jgi:hypothetical protein
MRPIVAIGLLAFAPATALAQETDEPTTPPTAVAVVKSGENVTMPAKRLFLHVNFELGLSKGAAGDPISISPDLWYGVNDKITVGIAHSSMGLTGFMGFPGSALCLSGDLCGSVYDGFMLDGRYQLKTGKISIAGNVGLGALATDPFQLAAKLGVVGRWRPSADSKLAVDFQPAVFFGITEREGATPMMGVVAESNKETVVAPATLLYGLNKNLSIALQTGFIFEFSDPGATFVMPASIGASYWLNHQIVVDAAFSLPLFLGGDIAQEFDVRTFTLGGGYAF